jgi:hypothetical protein
MHHDISLRTTSHRCELFPRVMLQCTLAAGNWYEQIYQPVCKKLIKSIVRWNQRTPRKYLMLRSYLY